MIPKGSQGSEPLTRRGKNRGPKKESWGPVRVVIMRLKWMAKGVGYPRREARDGLGKEGEVLAAGEVRTEPEKRAQALLRPGLLRAPPGSLCTVDPQRARSLLH